MQNLEEITEEIASKEEEIDQLYHQWLAVTEAAPTRIDATADVFAKTMEALEMITDKFSNSKANPSIRSTGMSPPKWDGQFNNFYSWRLQFELYLKSATIDKDEDQLMFLLHTPVLPPRVTSSIQSCTTMIGPNGVWDRLEEKIADSCD